MTMDPKPVTPDDERPIPAVRCLDGGWTDEAIVDGLRRGEPAAAQAFFDAHADRIEGLVWRLLGPDTEHDDVVGQVLVNVARSVGSLRDPAALRSWLTGVTINTVKKEIGRRQRRPVLVPTEALPELPDGAPGPDDLAVARGLYRVLDRLEPDDRLLLILRYVQGCTLPELAAALERSLATVKRHLTRARERFAEQAREDFWLSTLMGEDR
jgi:RNA polymerase sigma-70 factor (ECF subfamily)